MADLPLARRAALHQALGDEHRLTMVDALRQSDLTPTELREVVGVPSNLLAFHLDVLEDAGVIERHASLGDGRRRYVTLRLEVLDQLVWPVVRARATPDGLVLFVCTHNAARSQLAAAVWTARTGRSSLSAGIAPADHVHPLAVEVARRHGLDLTSAAPRGYDEVDAAPQLVVSVCDRAREAGLPFDVPMLHWSIPDPSGGTLDDFEVAYTQIEQRVERLASGLAA